MKHRAPIFILKVQLLVVPLAMCLLYACSKHENKEITKIEFAKSPCFLPCVPTAISMDSALNYQCYVDSSYVKGVTAKRSYSGRINRSVWNELLIKLEEIDYKHLDTAAKQFPSDVQHVELIIYSGTHRIRLETESSDSKVGKVLKWINSTYKKVQLKSTTNLLHLGTTLQLDPRLIYRLPK